MDELAAEFLPFLKNKLVLRMMRQTIRGWRIQLKCDKELSDLSKMFNPILRGWVNYYSRFHGSAMASVWRHLNAFLTRWLRRKYKHVAWHKTRARRLLGKLAAAATQAFAYWVVGFCCGSCRMTLIRLIRK